MKAGKQNLAYELYASLGEKRAYSKVAAIMGLSVKTINSWGWKYNWAEKLEQEYRTKSEQIKAKREKLEDLGLETAILALGNLKTKIENDSLNVDMARVFEIMLKTPLSLGIKAESVDSKSAFATPGKENIEIVFNIEEGLSFED